MATPGTWPVVWPASSHSLPCPGWLCPPPYGSPSFWRAWRCCNPTGAIPSGSPPPSWPVALLLVDPTTRHHFNLWTPYQQIEVEDENFPNGELSRTQIRVNHPGYQIIADLSSDFLARHPNLLREAPNENPYNLPFRFTTPNP